MTAAPSDAALEMARHLLARELPTAGDPAGAAALMQKACTRLSANLRRSFGNDGYAALLGRAFARTRPGHPALNDIRRGSDDDIYLDGVVASVQAHGVPVVAAALESLVASLIDVLSGLIGADMVRNLLDHDGPPPRSPDAGQAR